MNEEEIRLIKGYFNNGYCCDLDELKDIANKMINENQQLKKQKDDIVKFIKEFHNFENRFKWCEQDYLDTIEKIEGILGEIDVED